MAAIGEMFADDLTWHEFGRSRWPGPTPGAEVMKLDLGARPPAKSLVSSWLAGRGRKSR